MSYFDQNLEASRGQREARLIQLQPLSRTAREFPFQKLERGAFELIEKQALAEARVGARKSGRLFPTSYRDDAGRKITEYEGDAAACWAPFMVPGLRVKLNLRPDERQETVTLKHGQHAEAVNNK